MGDIAAEDKELRKAMAKASLRNNWKIAQSASDRINDDEIEKEIALVRTSATRRKKK